MSEFYYNIWNLFSHTWEIAKGPNGDEIYFHLDGVWRIYGGVGMLKTIDSANDLCAWLNRCEYKPTGKKHVEAS